MRRPTVRELIVYAWMSALLVAVAWLGVRAHQVDRVVVELRAEIRADCQFKRDIADLPREARPRAAGLVRLATDARDAYIGKGCAELLGPPPPRYTADPTPSPTPRK